MFIISCTDLSYSSPTTKLASPTGAATAGVATAGAGVGTGAGAGVGAVTTGAGVAGVAAAAAPAELVAPGVALGWEKNKL